MSIIKHVTLQKLLLMTFGTTLVLIDLYILYVQETLKALFVVSSVLPTHCRYRGLLSYLITYVDTYTVCRTSLNESWAVPLQHTTRTRHEHPCTLVRFAIISNEHIQACVLNRATSGIG